MTRIGTGRNLWYIITATSCWYACLFTIRCSLYGAYAFIPMQQQHKIFAATSTSTSTSIKRKVVSIIDDHRMIRKRETLLYNRLLEFLDVYKSKIPKELEEEIYLAEANTEAAKDRGQRVALYIVLSIVGVSIASFNGFLTEMRSDSNFSDLEQARFNWVGANPIFSFFLTTRLGGGIGLLCGGASGLLAEAEFDTKRLNAEKIYEELERRRDMRLKKSTKKQKKPKTRSSKKLRLSGKKKRQIQALSEVLMDDDDDTNQNKKPTAITTKSEGLPVNPGSNTSIDFDTQQTSAVNENKDGNDDQSIFGKMKELYNQADSMAASQALIMNKNLEEAGVVEKITDETGLRVIGREEVKKALEEKTSESKKK